MSKVPAELKYVKSHEWLRIEADGSVTIGITDHAQQALGDLVFVEVPEIGRTLSEGESCAVVESVKAASDVYAPIAGEVVAVNDALGASPDLINEDAYGEGWIFRVKPVAALDGLMSAGEYEAYLKTL